MKKLNEKVSKVELYLGGVLLFTMFALIFVSAVTRTFGYPINWAQDFCLILFAWLAFIGGDYLMRSRQMVNIDLLRRRLPPLIQKILTIVFDLLILAFLIFLIKNGFTLISKTKQRMITTVGVSYTWVTSSVPVGAIVMSTTVLMDLIIDIQKPLLEYRPKLGEEEVIEEAL